MHPKIIRTPLIPAHTAPTTPSIAPVIPAATAHTPEYTSAPVASTPRTVTNVWTKVFTPLTTTTASVRLITTFVRALYPQTLYQKVSASVAVTGSNAAALASARDGVAAAAGVNMKVFVASPRTRVSGSRVMGVAL